MSKLIPMEEAARMLGMSVEQLTELRSNNEIFGYRDGSKWKFKQSELERVAGELGVSLQSDDDELDLSDDLGFEMTASSKEMIVDDDSIGDEMESAEYMEDSSAELIQDEPSSDESSSVDLDVDDDAISLVDSGRLKQGTSKDDFGDGSGELKLEGSSLKLGGSDVLGSGEDVLGDEEELSFGSSSLRLASESSKKGKAADDDSDVLDEVSAGKDSPSDTGKMLGEAEDDDLLMSEDDLFSDDLSLADSSSFEDSAELSSDFEDSDLVLDDSDSSTEITLEANESGINLSPNESGISLADEPLELGGSDIDALELPEDDDMIVLENAASADEATMMQEDDFNLTPLEESMDEDDSSGSQVIALEDSEIYADESAGTVLGEEEFEAQPAMLDDTMGGDFGYDPTGGQVLAGAAAPAAAPEAPYTVAQVVSLGLVATLLTAGGMVAYNLAQNMWLPEDQVIGSSVLNFFLKLTGMN